MVLYPPSCVIKNEARRGDDIHARFIIVRYSPRFFPTFDLSPKCSMKMSMQNNIWVFVETNITKAVPIMYGLVEVIIPTKEDILIKSKMRVNFLLPKNFRILALFESSINVAIEARVYRIPTYFSDIISVRNVELTYADNAICKVKRNDKTYILLIVVIFIF
jgi:hypothetical protein